MTMVGMAQEREEKKKKIVEELRNSIMSTVKQSAALNRPGAENMKPRQLSDAIHQEVGDQVMSQISDSVWELIRSADGMKAEIRETVQSVYNKLSNPNGNDNVLSASCTDAASAQKDVGNAASANVPANETENSLTDGEPNEPPGFSLYGLHLNNPEEQASKEQQLSKPLDKTPTGWKEDRHCKDDDLEPDNFDPSAPPGFPAILQNKQPLDDGDEDPDVPPGFG